MDDHQRQLTDSNCGQTCIAMITGVSQYDAMHAVGKDGGTNVGLLKAALFNFGYDVELRRGKKSWPPQLAIVLLSSKREHEKDWGHAIVVKDGMVHDPGYELPWKLSTYEAWLKARGLYVRSQIVILGKRH